MNKQAIVIGAGIAGLASALEWQGDLAGAREELDRAIGLDPGDEDLWKRLEGLVVPGR